MAVHLTKISESNLRALSVMGTLSRCYLMLKKFHRAPTKFWLYGMLPNLGGRRTFPTTVCKISKRLWELKKYMRSKGPTFSGKTSSREFVSLHNFIEILQTFAIPIGCTSIASLGKIREFWTSQDPFEAFLSTGRTVWIPRRQAEQTEMNTTNYVKVFREIFVNFSSSRGLLSESG